jgi:Fic family protein
MTESEDEGHYEPFPSFVEFRLRADADLTVLDRFEATFRQTAAGASEEVLAAAVERATKVAAIDTGAIEGLYEVERGFTITVASQAAAWDSIHLEKGEKVQRAIHDALAGYDMVLDLVTQRLPMTEAFVRELHATLCASQETYQVITAVGPQEQPLPKGRYKSHPNSPFNLGKQRVHHYAPPSDTSAEMHRLVEELTSADFDEAHPVLQAAYAHYAFVCVHPFADGNGRVARALASIYLYRRPGVPLVIFVDQKAIYIDALEQADEGDYKPLIGFLRDRVIDTIQMVQTELQRQPAPSMAERMAQIRSAVTGRGGLTYDEIDALGLLLAQTVHDEATHVINAFGFEPPLAATVNKGGGGEIPDGFRALPTNNMGLVVTVQTMGTGASTVQRVFMVWAARGSNQETDFCVQLASGPTLANVLIRDLRPEVGTALRFRLRSIIEDQINRMLDEVQEATTKRLREQGYL